MKPLVLPLEQAPEANAAGGKAQTLGRLIALDMPVPDGVVITCGGLEMFLEANGLRATVDSGLEPEAIRTLVMAASVPHVLEEQIRSAVAPLGQAPFAVRSSAIGEDGSATSYAGLHDTALDVVPNDVDAAIRRCWASLWSRPAVAYRLRHGRPLDGGGMAVVVQALVPADASAVVFTRHPVTGTDEVVVTAVRGLGEMMASGTVTPDTIIVDRWSLDVLDYTPGEDESAVGAVALSELVHQSLEVERQYGCAVDIEAARAGGRWYLLQARPITTR